MNLKSLTDEKLHTLAIETSERERAVTLELLKQLSEIERRRLYSKFACSSLHMYCVRQLKMTDGDAGRKVAAARLIREVPVIEEKILSGSLPVTSVAQVGVFFKKESRAGHSYKMEEKAQLLRELEDRSTRQIETILISKSNQPEIHFRETQKTVASDRTEIKLFIDNETLEALSRLKEIWSHAMPHANLADVIKRTAQESVERHDPVRKAARQEAKAKSDAKCDAKSAVKREVRHRDGDQCTFVDAAGKRCESRHFLEEDHILPKAMGGGYTVENIRLRCRAHNQRHAIECYGWSKMANYVDPH
jgi:hypothetical protein